MAVSDGLNQDDIQQDIQTINAALAVLGVAQSGDLEKDVAAGINALVDIVNDNKPENALSLQFDGKITDSFIADLRSKVDGVLSDPQMQERMDDIAKGFGMTFMVFQRKAANNDYPEPIVKDPQQFVELLRNAPDILSAMDRLNSPGQPLSPDTQVANASATQTDAAPVMPADNASAASFPDAVSEEQASQPSPSDGDGQAVQASNPAEQPVSASVLGPVHPEQAVAVVRDFLREVRGALEGKVNELKGFADDAAVDGDTPQPLEDNPLGMVSQFLGGMTDRLPTIEESGPLTSEEQSFLRNTIMGLKAALDHQDSGIMGMIGMPSGHYDEHVGHSLRAALEDPEKSQRLMSVIASNPQDAEEKRMGLEMFLASMDVLTQPGEPNPFYTPDAQQKASNSNVLTMLQDFTKGTPLEGVLGAVIGALMSFLEQFAPGLAKNFNGALGQAQEQYERDQAGLDPNRREFGRVADPNVSSDIAPENSSQPLSPPAPKPEDDPNAPAAGMGQ